MRLIRLVSRPRSTTSHRRFQASGLHSISPPPLFFGLLSLALLLGSLPLIAGCGSISPNTKEADTNNPNSAPAAALSNLACASGSLTGPAADACTVTLASAASTGGQAVSLASNYSFVAVPNAVTVPGGATTAAFTVAVGSVNSSQAVTLTATVGSATKTFSLMVAPEASGGTGATGGTGAPALTANASTVSFGNVALNTAATQTVTLTSSGSNAVTVSNATVSGAGFALTGGTVPVTLAPGQTANLDLQFDPAGSGSASGNLTITSNAVSGATITIALAGTGESSTTYQVNLTWDAPSSSTDPLAGYNIYRASSSGGWQLLNGSVNTTTTFTDAAVQNGATYTYEVVSVDAQGNQSAPSNTFTASIPD
jgi:hypothetical protein